MKYLMSLCGLELCESSAAVIAFRYFQINGANFDWLFGPIQFHRSPDTTDFPNPSALIVVACVASVDQYAASYSQRALQLFVCWATHKSDGGLGLGIA